MRVSIVATSLDGQQPETKSVTEFLYSTLFSCELIPTWYDNPLTGLNLPPAYQTQQD